MTNDDARRRFAEVVVPVLDDAYGLARWLSGSGADAQDIVQEASLRAYRAIAGFNGASPRAWMLTIVRNCAYSWLAKNRPKQVVLSDDMEAAESTSLASFGDTTAANAESVLIAAQDTARLEKAIGSLPIAYREALVMREAQGLAYRDIAAVLGLPIGTVMSRLARARELLAAALRETRT